MNAITYTEQELTAGRLRPAHIVSLVEAWQHGHNLEADGKCGPNTRASIEKTWPGPEGEGLAVKALAVAIENIGKGEEGGNNSGPFVEMLHGKEYDGDPDNDGSWCAAFVSWCFEQACQGSGSEMPFVRSVGAKRLFQRIGDAGEKVHLPFLQPGDVVCWDRGQPGSWQGHIGFVEFLEDGSILHTVEGNVGRFPAKVRRFVHDLDNPESRLQGFARITT